MSQGTTIAIPQPSRVRLATWIGLFLALFSMIIIRDAFRAFAPNAGPGLNLLKECLMFSSAGTVLWPLKRREGMPLRSIGLGTHSWRRSSSNERRFPILVYSSTANLMPAGNLKCGEKVYVLGRREPWLKIATSHGDRYIPVNAISERRNRFVEVNIPTPSEVVERPKIGRALPQVTAMIQPEYTQQARDAGIHGYVYLTVTIDVGGNVRDTNVVRRLGYGLDESAKKAVQSWKFEPALLDGVPIEFRAVVEVSFPPPYSGPPHATFREVGGIASK